MVVACRPEKLLLPWAQTLSEPNSLLIFPRWKVAILKSSFSFDGNPVVFQIYESLPEGFCEGPANAHPVDNRGMIGAPLAIHYIQPYLHIYIYSTYLHIYYLHIFYIFVLHIYIFILHIFYIYSTYTLHIFYIYSTYILHVFYISSTHTHTLKNMCIIDTHTQIHIYTCIYIQSYAYTCTHIHIHTNIHILMNKYILIYIYTNRHT